VSELVRPCGCGATPRIEDTIRHRALSLCSIHCLTDTLQLPGAGGSPSPILFLKCVSIYVNMFPVAHKCT
jgi:hypothetical protein